MTDFEKAMINACKVEFPDATLRGCFFHFTQCIFRQIQSSGLKQRYETDAEFALKMKMLPALAFVPADFVEQAFEILIDERIFPEEAQPVIDYFEDVWIGRPQRRQRRPPQFSHTTWSVYESVIDDLPKTNNSVEGWQEMAPKYLEVYKCT